MFGSVARPCVPAAVDLAARTVVPADGWLFTCNVWFCRGTDALQIPRTAERQTPGSAAAEASALQELEAMQLTSPQPVAYTPEASAASPRDGATPFGVPVRARSPACWSRAPPSPSRGQFFSNRRTVMGIGCRVFPAPAVWLSTAVQLSVAIDKEMGVPIDTVLAKMRSIENDGRMYFPDKPILAVSGGFRPGFGVLLFDVLTWG